MTTRTDTAVMIAEAIGGIDPDRARTAIDRFVRDLGDMYPNEHAAILAWLREHARTELAAARFRDQLDQHDTDPQPADFPTLVDANGFPLPGDDDTCVICDGRHWLRPQLINGIHRGDYICGPCVEDLRANRYDETF